jgi:hypothetical protein
MLRIYFSFLYQQIAHKENYKFRVYSNPDKPEKLATKAPRHKKKMIPAMLIVKVDNLSST